MRRSKGRALLCVSAVVVVVASAGGCYVDASSIDDDVRFACESTADCPPEWVCRAALGRCLPAEGLDEDAPAFLSEPVATPARASLVPGLDEVVIAFTLDEDVGLEPPGLSVLLGARPVACTSAPGAEGVDYRCGHTVGPDDPEGVHTVTVTVVDAAGNAASERAQVELDFTPPALAEASIVPALAARGDELRVRVIVTEPLVGAPALTADGPSALAFDALEDGGGVFTFSHRVAAGEDGAYALRLAGATDLAGNTPDAPLPVGDVVLDATAPVIQAVTADAGSYSRSAGSDGTDHSVVALEVVIADEAPATLDVLVGSGSAACGSCTESGGLYTCVCTYAVTGDDVEGLHAALVTAVDAAGNVAVDSSATVRLDFTGPELVEGTAAIALQPAASHVVPFPTRARDGTRVVASFALTEEVVAPPAVVTAPGALPLAGVASGGTTHVFALTVPAGVAEGAQALDITAEDAVGNVATSRLADAFIVDVTAPPAPDTQTPERVVFTRAPFGTADSGGAFFTLTGDTTPGDAALALALASASGPEIARGPVDDAGAFAFDVPPPDRSAVWLALADGAGNVSSASAVRDMAWVASLGGELRGDDVANPTRVTTTAALRGTLPAGAVEPSQADLDALAEGSASLTVAGELPFTTVASSAPSARGLAAVAFDAARGVAVVFSGAAALQQTETDTWEYDPLPGSWRIATTPTSPAPAPGFNPVLGFDSGRGRIVFVGGGAGDDAATWEWSGALWEPAPGPGPDDPAVWFAYDEARARLVTGTTQGLWERDGDRWLPRGPREGLAAAWDPILERVVAFAPGRGVPARTALWDGSSWTVACDLGTCGLGTELESAVAKDVHAIWDAGRERVVVTLGLQNDPADALWEYDRDAAVWQRAPAPPWSRPVVWAAPVSLGPAGDIALLSGASRALDDEACPGGTVPYLESQFTDGLCTPPFGGGCTCIWDGGWVRRDGVWSQLRSPGTAPDRSRAQTSYDEDTQEVLVFGGRFGFESCPPGSGLLACNDTFTFGTAGWRDRGIDPQLSPAGREEAGIASAVGGGVLLVGGVQSVTDKSLCEDESVVVEAGIGPTCVYGDTWLWADGAWTEVAGLDTGPPARRAPALGWDATGDAPVLFGGHTEVLAGEPCPAGAIPADSAEFFSGTCAPASSGYPCTCTFLDTWTWDANGDWQELPAAGGPGRTTWWAVAGDGADVWLIAGPEPAVAGKAWRLAAGVWQEVAVAGEDPASTGGTLRGFVHDPDRDKLVALVVPPDFSPARVFELDTAAATWTEVTPSDPVLNGFNVITERAVYDTGRRGVMLIDKQQGPRLRVAGSGASPAAVWRVPLPPAGPATGRELLSVGVRSRCAGESEVGDGCRVALWNAPRARWDEVGAGVAAPGAPADVDGLLEGHASVRAHVRGRDDALHVAVLPLAPNGTAPELGRVELAYLEATVSWRATVCGDGTVDADEACDDGDTDAGDGCSPTCVVEWCGDGIKLASEGCDDGNLVAGDGCSSSCEVEP